QGNDAVADKEGLANVGDAGVLFQNHGHNVRAAGGGVVVEHQRRAHGGKHHGKAQLQQGLVGKGGVHGVDALQHPGLQGVHQAAIGGPKAELLAQKQVAQHQQQDVDNAHQGGGGEEGNHAAEEDCQAADAAGGEVVGKLEKVDAHRKQQHA